MTKYVVTSQPRTSAKNNFIEAPSSNKYQEDEDNDQCCFVYFYTLYCSRCRCSGCCGDEKQKRSRPQRRVFDNYNSDPLFVDDTNTLNFLNDEINTYEPYNRHLHARAEDNEQGSNMIGHGGDFDEHPGCYNEYDGNRSESGGDHFAGTPGGIHVTSDTKDLDHCIGFAHNDRGEHSISVCYTDINNRNVGHTGGTGQNNSHWGGGGHSGSHCGGGDHSWGGDTGGGDSGRGDSGCGDTGGGESGGGNTGGGDSGGGDTGGGDSGGGDTGGGDSGGGDTGGGGTD